jgi:SAM-dependent methyltransferase
MSGEKEEVIFKDHFSRQATDYAKFRPHYPRAFFKYIASVSPNNQVALDCATGNGQAAVALAEFFARVIAIDASENQIARAQPQARVEYQLARAEATGLSANSCDAMTVAQALHWFDLDAFHSETRRILKPGGLLAVWAYNELRISPEVDALVRHFHDEIVGPYWPPERKIVGRGYRNLPFPFEELRAPSFQIEVRWSLEHLLGYLRTWSATQCFLAASGRDPVELIERDLARTWDGAAKRKRLAIWPLTIRLGRA